MTNASNSMIRKLGWKRKGPVGNRTTFPTDKSGMRCDAPVTGMVEAQLRKFNHLLENIYKPALIIGCVLSTTLCVFFRVVILGCGHSHLERGSNQSLIWSIDWPAMNSDKVVRFRSHYFVQFFASSNRHGLSHRCRFRHGPDLNALSASNAKAWTAKGSCFGD